MHSPNEIRFLRAGLFCLLSVVVSTDLVAAEYPRLMWEVSDDELLAPLGAILDAAVDADGTVYLLDSQVKEVRRIAIDGSELPPIGREGEGPGEFDMPTLIASMPGGGCLVLQDFHRPAVCLIKNGNPCVAPDVGLIRQSFSMTAFMGKARIDARGCLFVSAFTTEHPYDPLSPDKELGYAMSVFRLERGGKHAVVLFTNSPAVGDERSVRYKEDMKSFAFRCWDVDDTGRIIYADPAGQYRVLLGHPADGTTTSVELTPLEGDEQAIRKSAKKTNRTPETYPRIADVQWISRNIFMAKPTAATAEGKMSPGGVVEFFELNGTSLGRRTITHGYNPELDWLFIRGHVMVIVPGGQSTYRASIDPDHKTRADDDEESIIVRAYDLTPR